MEIFIPFTQHPSGHRTFSIVYWHPAPYLFYTSDSDAQEQTMTQGTVQLVAGILAVILIAIVIMRRKGGKKKDEDDF
jgi:hypothetical protein